MVNIIRNNLLEQKFNQFSRNFKQKLYKIIYPSVISIKTKKKYAGDVLVSYIIPDCLFKKVHNISKTHSNEWECLQIANIFLNLGYNVDIINWTNNKFLPKKNYSFFIDIHSNMERLAPILNKDCIKIFHITGAHWQFQNSAEHLRLLKLQKRRGITLISRRMVTPNLAIEYCDYATILGNEFTVNTYAYAKKPIYKIPLSTAVLFEFNENKNFGKFRRNFLWLGSLGLVHKGLDLVLEVFNKLPEYKLYICGKISEEKDFEEVFYKELYNTPNIETLGWVDISTQKFLDITNNCVGLIYPSCSEGQAGSVVTCLHAGLIPIISYESGVDIDNFGIILKQCTIKEIKSSIEKLSNFSSEQLKKMSKEAWEYARANHTRVRFAEKYKNFVVNILMKKEII